ncbi:BTB/POZ and TAZ domain-containing protein 1 [Cucurbita argyrosperma subsp. argyrosperma]
MEALHLPYEVHPHSPAASVKDRSSQFQELPEPDIHIVTSSGLRIPAYSTILASVSSVLENIIDESRKHRSSEKLIRILGVPSEAVVSFVQFLFTSRCSEECLREYGIHLLALSHVYLVPHLKQRCSKYLARKLTIDSVIDILQLARLCDAPDLSLSCMKMVSRHFKAVEKSEGWKFLQEHDSWLELQILQFIDESELRKKRCRRQRKEKRMYLQLSDAIECVEHICKEGCTDVGPHDAEPTKKPCSKFSTCRGVQLLIKHFATCKDRAHEGGCWRCKQMWQLLRLHASICNQSDACKVPLCRQFKQKMQQENRKDDAKWKVLMKKVMAAKTISSLTFTKRKRPQLGGDTMSNAHIRSCRLETVEQNRSLLLTA